jgi:hypothetical protein
MDLVHLYRNMLPQKSASPLARPGQLARDIADVGQAVMWLRGSSGYYGAPQSALHPPPRTVGRDFQESRSVRGFLAVRPPPGPQLTPACAKGCDIFMFLAQCRTCAPSIMVKGCACATAVAALDGSNAAR